MATTTFDLQRQIKDNTRQYQDFVNNLNNWQVEISALDAQTTETSLAAEPYDVSVKTNEMWASTAQHTIKRLTLVILFCNTGHSKG